MNSSEPRAANRISQDDSGDQGIVTPDRLFQLGLQHFQADRVLDAQSCCRRALELESNHPDSLHLMGLLCFRQGLSDLAVDWIARAIRQKPDPEYLTNFGTVLNHQGRHEEALRIFNKMVQLTPELPEAWNNLGKVLVELRRPADALLSFQRALELDPRHWDAACSIGRVLHDLKRPEEALAYLDRADELAPNRVGILAMRAIVLNGLKRLEEALADSARAHSLDPANVDVCCNAGILLATLGRYAEALSYFDSAIALRPNCILALNHKAALLRVHRRFDEAIATYGLVKTLDPDNAEADLGLGHLNLSIGNLAAGWDGFEARRRIPSMTAAYPDLPRPLWRGEAGIEGKTILICSDEGLGDAIQFARFVPMLAARGARVILVADVPLHPLLSRLSGVAQCVPKVFGPLPAFDLHCPMCSLPAAFGTRLDTIPAEVPYLPAPAQNLVQAWEERLGSHRRLRIGLSWAGNPNHGNDHNRSLPLQALLPILDLDATFVSLQKDPRPEDKATLLARPEIIDLTDHLRDFDETAALVSCLDLVISVDTSIAHLAGGLGRPTWLLLPMVPDWRWLLDREDSPWYPTMRLFRQPQARDYASVLDRVRSELEALISARPNEPG